MLKTWNKKFKLEKCTFFYILTVILTNLFFLTGCSKDSASPLSAESTQIPPTGDGNNSNNNKNTLSVTRPGTTRPTTIPSKFCLITYCLETEYFKEATFDPKNLTLCIYEVPEGGCVEGDLLKELKAKSL